MRRFRDPPEAGRLRRTIAHRPCLADTRRIPVSRGVLSFENATRAKHARQTDLASFLEATTRTTCALETAAMDRHAGRFMSVFRSTHRSGRVDHRVPAAARLHAQRQRPQQTRSGCVREDPGVWRLLGLQRPDLRNSVNPSERMGPGGRAGDPKGVDALDNSMDRWPTPNSCRESCRCGRHRSDSRPAHAVRS